MRAASWRVLRCAAWSLVLWPACARAAAPAPDLEARRLKAHVATLASPAFQGRRGEGGRKAAAYLVEAFRDLGLEPLFAGDYLQPIPARADGMVLGRNVGARLIGSDPAWRDEWIIVSAHFDHLGVQDGILYPGADDNASGVAMLLEVARAWARSPEQPRRSLMFLGFDLEEAGLIGSRHFVEHPPVPLDRIALFITAGMIGRSFAGVCQARVFVMGSEHAPGLRPWIDRASRPLPLKVGLIGTDLLLIDRSDYGPFRARGIPFLFFSTGENPVYHKPQDVPETVDYPQLEAVSRLIQGVVREAASAAAVPRWDPEPDHPLAEAAAIRDVIRTLLEHRDSLQLGAAQVFLMNNTVRSIDGMLERRAITPAERTGLIRVARLLLVSSL
jgi:hypothetical protein